MKYQGVIILESLEDTSVLEKVQILSTEVETVTERFGTPWLTQWTLHTVEVAERDIDEVARQVASALDHAHATAWYADFKNETHHYIIFRGTVFRINRASKKEYQEAWEFGLKNGTPEHQLIRYPGVSTKALAAFLSKANKHTYANATAEKASSLRPQSEDYHFEEGTLTFHDTYFGSRDFVGEEIIYHAGKPVWGANYYGTLLDDDMPESTLATFLRKALMQESDEAIPVRGPKQFEDGEWNYKFNAEGELGRFTGFEEISHKGNLVFELGIHGGFIG